VIDTTGTARDGSGAAVSPAHDATPLGDGMQLTLGAWAYFEGRIVPSEDAKVSIATHALNYGTAVFEGIRAYRQDDGGLSILLGLEHYERLLRNGRLLRASVPESAQDLLEVSRELLRRNQHTTDVYIRPLLYKGALSLRLQLTDLDDRIAIYTFPMGDYMPTTGVRATLSAWQRVNDNAIPARGKITGSYVNACFATEDAHAGGYGEAVLLTADGHVAEASSANLFVVHGADVSTPPLADDVLPGITRGAVMRIAADAGYPVAERKIDRTELYVADEVFLTGTGAQLAPVASIDGRPVGSGAFPIATELQERYFAAVRGRDPRFRSWLTPV
jgi:branched-chain amino acid aminotransferase